MSDNMQKIRSVMYLLSSVKARTNCEWGIEDRRRPFKRRSLPSIPLPPLWIPNFPPLNIFFSTIFLSLTVFLSPLCRPSSSLLCWRGDGD